MKRFISICMIAVMAVMCWSCQHSELQKKVEQLNSQCPKSYNGGQIEVLKYEYDHGKVTISCALEEYFSDFDAINANKDAFKQNFLQFMNSIEGFKELENLIIKENASLSVCFQEKNTGKQIVMDFSAKELSDVNDMDKLSPEENILLLVKNWNIQCPEEFEEGMTITKYHVEGDYVVYYIKLENEYNLRDFKANKAVVKGYMQETYWDKSDVIVAKTVEFFKAANKGVLYRFYCKNPDNCVDVKINCSEL